MKATLATATFDSAAFRRSAAKPAGMLLNAAEYVVVKGQFVAPGRHRLLLAGGLSAGLFGGQALTNVITGQHMDGSPVHRDNVILPLRPLTGLMPFNTYSDNPNDRWRHSLASLAPAVAGATGVILASRYHFRDRINAGKAIEEVVHGVKQGMVNFGEIEHAIMMKQAEPMEKFTALSSLPGSASGANMSPGGYSMGLSSLFTLRGGKKAFMGAWNPFRGFTRTVATSPEAAGGMMQDLWQHLLANPKAGAEELHELDNLGGGVLKSMIRGVGPEHVEAWKRELLAHRAEILVEASVLKDGQVARTPELLKRVSQASWARAEQFGIRHGLIDMRSPEAVKKSLFIGDNGTLGKIAEKMSAHTAAEIEALRENYARAVYDRNLGFAKQAGLPHGEALPAAERYVAPPAPPARGSHYAALGAAGAAGAAMIGYGATRGNREEQSRAEHLVGHQDRLAHFINGVPLSVTEWVGNALNFPPGLHRLKNAAGLSAGMFSGMKLGEAITGMTLTGKAVAKEAVFAPLRPMYGKATYDFHGADNGNRWARVAHFMLPAIGGFYGSKFGSDLYFTAQRERNRNAQFIDDYSAKISYDQSTPWSYLSATAALTNVGLGFAFTPLNYGTFMGNRFLSASDRKVVLPGLKESWSNNHSRYPLGPTQLRNYMINYVVNNPDSEPRQLTDMARGILNPWFGEQPESRVQKFVADIMDVRNKFTVDGAVPKENRTACRRAMRESFVGQGLHDELSRLGLDVLQARLADNGLSGDIANHLGARRAVEQDLQDFRAKELQRRAQPTRERNSDPAEETRAPGFLERVQRVREQQQGTSPGVS